jgi:signal transduction histidine kinase
VYFFSSLNRQSEFRKRIKNRALTTAGLLLKNNIDTTLLKKIDEATLIALQQKTVRVYDYDYNTIYTYSDNNARGIEPGIDVLGGVRLGSILYFRDGNRDAIAMHYNYANKNYIVVAAAYDEDGYNKLRQLLVILAVSFSASVLIVLVSGWVFSGRLVIPIRNINNEVNDITSQNLSRRIKLTEPKDELYQLASTFNNLLSRLQKSFEIQKRFISNASHELSTPLTSISSQLEITVQKPRDIEEYQTVLRSVYEDVKDLSRLTKSLLEIARASGTPEGLDITMVRADELLLKLPKDISKINDQYIVKLYFDNFPENEEDMFILGNADLLYSAVKNVSVNACKYSADHVAHIHLLFSKGALTIVIKDEGTGIGDDEKALIFQPFYRGNNQQANGFGLGLPLAASIIKLHKGTIEVTSAKGKGSTFTITLPAAKVYHQL